jgi:hypothetical protein
MEFPVYSSFFVNGPLQVCFYTVVVVLFHFIFFPFCCMAATAMVEEKK